MAVKRVCLIDAKNQLFRMNAVNGNLSRSDGFPTGALHGVLSSTIAIAKRMPDTSFVWVWDGEGETWRHKSVRENYLVKASYEANTERAKPLKNPKKYGYKAHREKKEDHSKSKYPEESKARAFLQIPILRLILEGSGFRSYEVPNLEADDLIAILTRYLLENTSREIIIHSGDHDFYQLLANKNHHRVKILANIQKGDLSFVDRKEIKSKYHVSVDDWVKFRAWTGDKSDNIPHLRDVGFVVAAKLLKAGLDPSLKYGEVIDNINSDWKKLKRFFEPLGLERMWPFVESNYKLCKLISRPDDSRLPKQIQSEVKQLLDHIHFSRDKKKVTAETYRRISHLFIQYQLRSVLSKRDVLWRIP
jgi:5'-3' exonuclease